MKAKLLPLVGLVLARTANAALNIAGADGSDGVFPPPNSPTNIVVDLGLAVPAGWNANNFANAGKGVYDAGQWAIIYKYSSVNIPKGTTVTFKNHPSHAPVVWLVSGNVTIDGTIDVSGRVGEGLFHEPGPGGFRGGAQAQSGLLPWGGGMGPGGSFAENGYYGPVGTVEPSYVYGNARIVPLIGGSGGRGSDGSGDPRNLRGGAGGGAILIASQNALSVNGAIVARPTPGNGNVVFHRGSGGAIRLIANELSGSGSLDASGLTAENAPGGDGRTRVEAVNYPGGLNIVPPTIRVLPDSPPVIFPENLPTARVVSVAGRASPADPRANLTDTGSDVAIQNNKPVEIEIETTNLEPNSTVTAHIIPRHGLRFTADAKWVSGNTVSSRWVATTTVPPGFAVVQVRAQGK